MIMYFMYNSVYLLIPNFQFVYLLIVVKYAYDLAAAAAACIT